jgi:hypothetical protein
MKTVFLLAALGLACLAPNLPAQTPPSSARLAVLAEDATSAPASDLLLAAFSRHPGLHLLERTEIDKVYREQALSAANPNVLKLGRVLGADGLLAFNLVQSQHATNLVMRLLAVKPGVVLIESAFPWPLPDVNAWANQLAARLDGYAPKLLVLPKDAIPLSIVNLRSAVSTEMGKGTERQLKLLTLQRLSREPRIFVLDRERLQLLSEEKQRNGDESAFWNGAYLLEGVIDQNGYSAATLTLNARLTPPHGGQPLMFEVSGARTNYAEILNQLSAKVLQTLAINPSAKEWNSAEEARQFYSEALWALRWGIIPEAQTASEAAWALGKQDMDCAIARIRSYPGGSDIALGISMWEDKVFLLPDVNRTIRDLNREVRAQPGYCCLIGERGIEALLIRNAPSFQGLEHSLRALELYDGFSRSLPSTEVKWDSAWCRLGIEQLNAASEVLMHYYLVPGARPAVAEKLAELRSLARSVAQWISALPSVRDTYFVGDRIVPYDDFCRPICEQPNIYQCKMAWGSLWQENPEACLALYRELMGSVLFGQVHGEFWQHPLQFPYQPYDDRCCPPRLAAWNDQDSKRIPKLWTDFLNELNHSTNAWVRLEARALEVADADAPCGLDLSEDVAQQIRAAFSSPKNQITNAFNHFMAGLAEDGGGLATNNVDVLYLDWRLNDLIDYKAASRNSKAKEAVFQRYRSECQPMLQTLKTAHEDYVKQLHQLAAFGAQKQYLRESTPYNWFAFNKVFANRSYTADQAVELLPLLIAYQSNLFVHPKELCPLDPTTERFRSNRLAQGKSTLALEKLGCTSASNWIEFSVAKELRQQVNASPVAAPRPQQAAAAKPPASSLVLRQPSSTGTIPHLTNSVASVLSVSRFLPLPVAQLAEAGHFTHGETLGDFNLSGVRWCSGKLVCNLSYGIIVPGESGDSRDFRFTKAAAAFLFDPAAKSWRVVPHPPLPPDQQTFSPGDAGCFIELGPKELLLVRPEWQFDPNGRGTLKGRALRYDFHNPGWKDLNLEQIGVFQPRAIVSVDARLYALSSESIIELAEDGKSTRVLAGTRRRPAVSRLDNLDSLASAILLSGPHHGLWVVLGTTVYEWDGKDWNERGVVPSSPYAPPVEPCEETLLFRSRDGHGAGSIWLWDKRQPSPELVVYEKSSHPPDLMLMQRLAPPPKSVWTLPGRDSLATAPVTFYRSNLYFFVESAALVATNPPRPPSGDPPSFPRDLRARQWTITETNGFHAKLICFSRDCPEPIVIPLKFDLTRGQPPLQILAHRIDDVFFGTLPTWMHFENQTLYLGQADTPGLWAIPVSELEAAIAGQKQVLLDRRVHIFQAAKQSLQEVMAKYDRNHNGVIDPDEKAEALGDPAFLETQLDAIDANHNGWLDPEELSWFHAGTNAMLAPGEQNAIEQTLTLMAAKLFSRGDDNGDGFLDQAELADLLSDLGDHSGYASVQFSFSSGDHNGRLDAEGLRSFMRQRLTRQMAPFPQQRGVMMRALRSRTNGPVDQRAIFKLTLENYWATHSSRASQGSSNAPPGAALHLKP